MSHIAAFYERTKHWNLTKLDQLVTEMMITTGNKFGFLIILQNANMVANGKVNRAMSSAAQTGHIPPTSRSLALCPSPVASHVLMQIYDPAGSSLTCTNLS